MQSCKAKPSHSAAPRALLPVHAVLHGLSCHSPGLAKWTAAPAVKGLWHCKHVTYCTTCMAAGAMYSAAYGPGHHVPGLARQVPGGALHVPGPALHVPRAALHVQGWFNEKGGFTAGWHSQPLLTVRLPARDAVGPLSRDRGAVQHAGWVLHLVLGCEGAHMMEHVVKTAAVTRTFPCP